MALDGFTEKLIELKILTNRQSGNPYDPTYRLYTGRKGIRSGFHKPVPSLSISNSKTARWLGIDSKKKLTELGVGEYLLGSDGWFAEHSAQEKLMMELLQLYPRQPDLVFVSQDSFYTVYALPSAGTF
jgi:hypothetical protein